MGQPVAEGAQPEGEEAIEGGDEEEDEEDEEPNVHSAASTGGPDSGTGRLATFCPVQAVASPQGLSTAMTPHYPLGVDVSCTCEVSEG